MGFLKSLFKSKKPEPKSANQDIEKPSEIISKPCEPVTPEQASKSKTIRVPKEMRGCLIAYQYENVDIAGVAHHNATVNSSLIGEKLCFESELINEYDKNAIKILCNGSLLGYVHKGKLQEMIRDWLISGDPIFAAVTESNHDASQMKFLVAFYRDPLYGCENWESITTALTKTNKKDICDVSRQEYYDSIEEDDILTMEYDSYEEDYIVFDRLGNELGEIGKTASKKIHNNEPEFEPIPVVSEITESEYGKYGADIIVYFKPRRSE